MDELLRRLAANNLADLEGLQITGTLPVRQDIVNDVLNDFLKKAQSGAVTQPGSNAPAAPASNSAPSLSDINWFALVNKLAVRFEEGKLVVDFEIRR